MAMKSSTVYDFTLNDIDGKPVSLSQFKGKVVMLVNTASSMRQHASIYRSRNHV